ncbi:phage tail sheath protein [Govanella unica]|uniref:Phage tail sheath protein n=1 Tax=Govanella unica TaxID=2975056 RepID=A0A9X3TW22_9PROT|nr:phage tail sheath protein [Govania unica]MDA5192791.1 phage tail sheath protein [Govania unica]
MATFKHGITVTEINTGTRTLTPLSTAIIGLVATAQDADVATFPLDRPVLVTDVETAIGKAGTTGTLRTALRAIADQTRPVIVVVRVAQAADEADTNANVIGDTIDGIKTGMQALLAAEGQLGVRPRILGAPGLDTQPVTAALAIVAKKLRGFAYARAQGDTIAEVITYRANFSARELMLLYPDFLAFNTTTATNAASYAVARALGLRALIDEDQGPQKTLSNVAVAGVVGLTRDIQWDIQSSETEAALLNEAEITALVRTSTGYRFWGNRTCSDEPLFAFESTVRVAQILADTIGRGMFWAVDKPLTPALVKDIIETINGFFRDLKTEGVILGARAWFDEGQNSTSSLKAGKLRIDYDYTVPPPLEDLGFNQRITDSYFADFAAQLAEA